MGAEAWEAIRPNLEKVANAADWWSVVTGPIETPAFDDETRAYLAQARLPENAIDLATQPAVRWSRPCPPSAGATTVAAMCRNITPLRGLEPPATAEEVGVAHLERARGDPPPGPVHERPASLRHHRAVDLDP